MCPWVRIPHISFLMGPLQSGQICIIFDLFWCKVLIRGPSHSSRAHEYLSWRVMCDLHRTPSYRLFGPHEWPSSPSSQFKQGIKAPSVSYVCSRSRSFPGFTTVIKLKRTARFGISKFLNGANSANCTIEPESLDIPIHISSLDILIHIL